MPKRTFLGSCAHVVNSALLKAGLTITKIPGHNTIERKIRSLIEHFQIRSVIDVGAHYGEFSTLIRSLGYTGEIVSFEPSEASFATVAAAAAGDAKWKVHRMCLGDEDGTVEIMQFHSSTFNSLHAPTEQAKSGVFTNQLQVEGKESVPIRRLDSIFLELGVEREGIYLKIDTQGHDLQVLAGAMELLPHVRMIQTELSTLRIYEDSPTLEEALAKYRALGFFPVGFYPISYDTDLVTVMEWDCILVRGTQASLGYA